MLCTGAVTGSTSPSSKASGVVEHPGGRTGKLHGRSRAIVSVSLNGEEPAAGSIDDILDTAKVRASGGRGAGLAGVQGLRCSKALRANLPVATRLA